MARIVSLESLLRGITFLFFFCLFIITLILEVFLRKLYYPFFGAYLKNLTGLEPHQFITRTQCKFFLKIFSIQVIYDFNAKLSEKDHPMLMMFTHGSNLDVYAITADLPIFLNYVAKRSLFKIPFVGYCLKNIGSLPIDRGDIQKAIKTLEEAGEIMRKEKKSVAIAPEGTRRRSRSCEKPRIQPFKKGPFHLAKNSKCDILPIVVVGAHRLWPPGQFFPASGTLLVRTCNKIPKEFVEKSSLEEIQKAVMSEMEKFLKELPDEVVFKNPNPTYFHFIFFFLLFIGFSFKTLCFFSKLF